MELLHKIENAIAPWFKSAPKLSPSARKTLAGIYPWLALIFGILQLLAAVALWNAGRRVDDAVRFVNDLSRTYGTGTTVDELGLFYWIALGTLLISGVILLVAYPALKAGKKQGWDLLFLGVLINLVYSFLLLFVDNYYGGGIARFIFALLGSAVGFWLLFEVREHFKGGQHHSEKKH